MKPAPTIACKECGKGHEIPPSLLKTITTIRKLHPDAKITSFHCDECRKSGFTADIDANEDDDFEVTE